MKRNSTGYSAPRPEYDRRDCSVRALSVAVECSYEQASAVFSAAGRRLKKGTSVDLSRTVHEDWLHMEPIPGMAGCPVLIFMDLYPKGAFVLHRRGHAFAVIDGVLHDWEEGTKARSEIISAWKVTEKTLAKIEQTRSLFE